MSMFPTRILVAVDGAPTSEPAIVAAAELSEKTGSEIHLVYVGEEITETRTPRSVGSDEEVGEKARELLDEKKGQIESAGGAVGNASVIPGSDTAEEIVKLTRDDSVGMAVVGNRGLGPLQYAVRGSVSTTVVREAFCPVLVVRADDDPTG